MAKAVLNGTVIADSDSTVRVEGNDYFPPESVVWDHFTANDRETTCPWKGVASYYDVKVGDETLEAVAWTYPTPSDAAAEIKDHVAFYRPIEVN